MILIAVVATFLSERSVPTLYIKRWTLRPVESDVRFSMV